MAVDAESSGTVTVLVASRDRPARLAACVRALAAADGPDLAAVVVVDQSRDHAADLPAALADVPGGPGLAAKLRHVRSDTVGVSRGRNIGLGLCATEVVAVTDDDCVVAPAWVARVAAAFRADSDLAALCGRTVPLGEVPPDVAPPSTHRNPRARLLSRRRDPSRHGSGNNLAFRRDAVLGVGGYDEALGPGTPVPAGEDADLLFRLLRGGARVRYDPGVTVAHEMWRTPEELDRLTHAYALGSGVYLARAALAGRDPVALAILLARLGGAGIRWGGNLLRGRPARRRTASRALAGTWEGVQAVLAADPAYGIGRAWIAGARAHARRGEGTR
jgi:cellulose synthase/poly-beta-1,6-N-acetylglucosamine synthase-like glycosyltransferase